MSVGLRRRGRGVDKMVSRKKFEAEILSLNTDTVAYAAAKGWKIISTDYPTLALALRHPRSLREVEFHFACDDWDEIPPSLSLHDAEGGRELPWAEWPKGDWPVGEHDATGKPFLCLPGIREYHTHQSHVGDSWHGYRLRGTYRLRDIVDRVQQKFEKSDA